MKSIKKPCVINPLCVLLAIMLFSCEGLKADIAINQVGYRPYDNKIAIIFDKSVPSDISFYIKDSKTNITKYQGTISPIYFYDEASSENCYYVDFTDFINAGNYYVDIPQLNETSYVFIIKNDIYKDVFVKGMKSYYYQRSGLELLPQFAGVYSRPAAYVNDAIIHSSAASSGVPSGTFVENSGGWYDAGDFGKKIVNAGFALGVLLNGYDIASNNINGIKLNIPQTNGMPDFLTEIKYELDWMLKMQRKDGGVYHLITTKRFPSFSTMPDKDLQKRYIVQVSSCATGVFAAVAAKASLIYKDFDYEYSKKLLKASKRAWTFLEENQNIVPTGGYHDPKGINNTGLYEDDNDKDERFWAAAELFKATGESKYNAYIKNNYKTWPYLVYYPASWKDVHNFGMFTYMQTSNDKSDEIIKNDIIQALVKYKNRIVENINKSGFKTALDTNEYYWGSNGISLIYGCDLIILSSILNDKLLIQKALAQLNYVMGSNSLGMSFVTDMGYKTPLNPAQIISVADKIIAPLPGFLVGGPDSYLDDPIIKSYQKQKNLPVAKCYIDNHLSYSTNEVCLSWQAPFVFLAGYFMQFNSTK